MVILGLILLIAALMVVGGLFYSMGRDSVLYDLLLDDKIDTHTFLEQTNKHIF